MKNNTDLVVTHFIPLSHAYAGLYLYASKAQLTDIIGSEPDTTVSGDKKVTCQWRLINKCTHLWMNIHDWKEYDGFDDDDIIKWHVSGVWHDGMPMATKSIYQDLRQLFYDTSVNVMYEKDY